MPTWYLSNMIKSSRCYTNSKLSSSEYKTPRYKQGSSDKCNAAQSMPCHKIVQSSVTRNTACPSRGFQMMFSVRHHYYVLLPQSSKPVPQKAIIIDSVCHTTHTTHTTHIQIVTTRVNVLAAVAAIEVTTTTTAT